MGRSSAPPLPLLEYLSYRAGYAYLSDLRCISIWQRVQLARVPEKIPAEAADFHTWNDAPEYLAQAPPKQTAEDARERLIAVLEQGR